MEMEKKNVYDRLLLSEGGGIITDVSKSAQQGDPTIIIGLGGTGVDALRVVKKKVYEQLRADNPDAAIPEYRRIGFLAVDTDGIKTGGNEFYHLKEEECLKIEVSRLNKNMEEDIKNGNKEFAWLQPDINLLGTKGAGTVRQVGRYCLFKNIDKITGKISELQRTVTADTENDEVSKVNVHIIAGISGGTGSGTFIDMCYIVRDLIGESATLFGYFFMPDVNLYKKEILGKALLENRIKNNGYAALKELDYTMTLDHEGETFRQYYGGPQKYLLKETSAPLVDLCHLVSATDKKGAMITNGYDYSMNIVGEYILSYLAEVEYKKGDEEADQIQTLEGHCSNVNRLVGEIKKEHGENLKYHILGASTTELPTKEIGTYLAAKLYQRLGSGLTENVPTYNDVETHAEAMGLTLNNLREKLRGKDKWTVTDAEHIGWTGRYDFTIEDACNTRVSQDGSLVMPAAILDPIREWETENSGNLKKNFEALTKDLDDFKLLGKGTTVDTLVGSVLQYLQNNVASDISYGAVYASRLIYNDRDKSLNDYLDGRIETVKCTVSGWYNDLELRIQDIEEAIAKCEKARTKKIGKKLNAQNEAKTKYKNALRAYYQKWLDIEIGEYIIKMIAVLKQQINEEDYENSLYPTYFKPMENMLIKLKKTFDSNLEFIHNPTTGDDDVFVWRMVKFKEIQNYVDSKFDEEIKNDSVAYNNFINEIMKQYEKWFAGCGNSENNVVNMINSYIGGRFKELLTASMESYLSNKFGIHGAPEQLQATIKKEIFNNGVLAKAEPKFYINQRYNDMVVVKKHYLSVPSAEVNICEVAKKLTGIDVRITGLNNRIFAVKFESGIPLYAYGLIDKLEQQYNAGGEGTIGRHLYEITARNKELNWSNLQSFIPYSIKPDACADGKELKKLYYDAVSRGLISENQYNPDGAYNVYELNEPVIKKKDDFMKEGRVDMNELNSYVAELKSYTDSEGKLDTTPDSDGNNNANIKTVRSLSNDGSKGDVDNGGADFTETCRIDYFVRFRGMQKIVKKSMKILDDVDAAIKEAAEWKAEDTKRQAESAKKNETVKLITDAFCFGFFIKEGRGVYKYNDVTLFDGSMDYQEYFVYQIYKTFISDAFTDTEREKLKSDVNNKFKEIDSDDEERIEEIKARYIDDTGKGINSIMKKIAASKKDESSDDESSDIETVYKLFEGEVQALLNLLAM